MRLIIAIIRPEKLGEVKRALFQAGVTGLTVSRVSGHGGEKEIVESYRASTVVMEFRDKVRLEIAVSEEFVDTTVRTLARAARTGQVGDGKIFIQPLERVVRIRTGEEDNLALTPVNAEEVRRNAGDD